MLSVSPRLAFATGLSSLWIGEIKAKWSHLAHPRFNTSPLIIRVQVPSRTGAHIRLTRRTGGRRTESPESADGEGNLHSLPKAWAAFRRARNDFSVPVSHCTGVSLEGLYRGTQLHLFFFMTSSTSKPLWGNKKSWTRGGQRLFLKHDEVWQRNCKLNSLLFGKLYAVKKIMLI